MKLTLVRHGETVENVNRIVQGHNPGTLTPTGRKQAKELAKKLSAEKFDRIYSSDLKRCVVTAGYIREFHRQTPFIKTEKLREIYYGSLQGQPASEIQWQEIEGDFLNRKPGGGESVTEFGERIIDFTNRILSKNNDKNILFVTHGGPMRMIKASAEGYGARQLEKLMNSTIPNGAIWKFDLSESLKLNL